MGANDECGGDFAQPPTGADALHLARSGAAIAACADHEGIGAAFQLAECRVVESIKKLFHASAQRGQIFGCCKEVGSSVKQVCELGRIGWQANHTHLAAGLGCIGGRLNHVLGAAGSGVPDDE